MRSYEQSLSIRQKLANASPSKPWLQSDVANSHSNIGYLERDTGRPAQAIESFERARSILQKLTNANPAVAGFRNSLALCLINVGQLKRSARRTAEALRAFEQALALKEGLPHASPDSRYDLACLLSQMTALNSERGSGGPAAPTADRAMRALREAVEAGFRDRKHMENDSDLDPLRTRSDFQLLMMDLAFPADLFVPAAR